MQRVLSEEERWSVSARLPPVRKTTRIPSHPANVFWTVWSMDDGPPTLCDKLVLEDASRPVEQLGHVDSKDVTALIT